MAVKLFIGEKEYDAEAISSFTLAELIALKIASGWGLNEFQRRLTDPPKDEDGNPEMDPQALGYFIWLLVRREQPGISVEEATSFPMTDLRIENDEEPAEEPAAADPTAAE